MSSSTKRSRRHDPGLVLDQLAVTLVGGGDCLLELQSLRNESDLFAKVASHPTSR
jgi:hypothetical protein